MQQNQSSTRTSSFLIRDILGEESSEKLGKCQVYVMSPKNGRREIWLQVKTFFLIRFINSIDVQFICILEYASPDILLNANFVSFVSHFSLQLKNGGVSILQKTI